MTYPRLTVANCTYNHARFLRGMLESVCSQSRPPDEFILLDDGSEDGTYGIMLEYAKRFPFIRVLRHPTNLGVVASHIRLLAEASGDYLAGVAADDLYQQGFLERVATAAASHPGIGLIFGRVKFMQFDGTPIPGTDSLALDAIGGDRLFIPETFWTDYLQKDGVYGVPQCSATFYEVEKLRSVGGFRDDVAGLVDAFAIWAVGMRHGAYLVNKPGTIFRVNPFGFHLTLARSPKKSLEGVAKIAALMRSREFRGTFSEHFVRRYIGDSRDHIIRGAGGAPSAYISALDEYLRCLSEFGPRQKAIGRALSYITAIGRRAQIAWLRWCLSRYRPL